jgi:hypothetical protein
MSLHKLVNIGPITQPSVGDNLRLFLVLFIAIFNNISFSSTAVNFIGGGNPITRGKRPTYGKSLTNLQSM